MDNRRGKRIRLRRISPAGDYLNLSVLTFSGKKFIVRQIFNEFKSGSGNDELNL
jgi:hypothetical protein